MNKLPVMIFAGFLLAACDGNPFTPDTPEEEPAETLPDDTEDNGGPITSDRVLPPGTSSPTPQTGIFRREARGEGAYHGNGFANNISYDSDGDVFYVQGLAFDHNQPEGTPYNRATANIGTQFAAYEAPTFVPDGITDTPIGQYQHRAIYGVSASGNTELAIVRTGSYTGYGFGGFIYQRNNDVVLPTQGQAVYTGQYAGLRDFSGVGGLEYTTGNMEVSIDFGGFSDNCTGARCSDAVRGYVTNRQVYNMSGTNVTSGILDAINTEDNANLIELPTLVFKVGPGVMDANGEITGTVDSTFIDNEGRAVRLDDGNYYAIISGDHTAGGEIVGVIVVESGDRRAPGVTVRETGGFIVDR